MPLTFPSFRYPIPEKIKKRLLLKLRIENIKRIKMISLASFVFLFLFIILDYLRFAEGKIIFGNIYFFLSLNHLCFSLFLIPLGLIEYHKSAIAIGKWKYTKYLIYAWTIFVGILLITMAILSLIIRDSLTMYTMYMIIANFEVLMLHKDRMILNGISFLIILVVCVTLNYQNIELLLLNILEISGVTLICFIVSNQLFNAFVKGTYNEKIVEEKSIYLEDQNDKIEAYVLRQQSSKLAAKTVEGNNFVHAKDVIKKDGLFYCPDTLGNLIVRLNLLIVNIFVRMVLNG